MNEKTDKVISLYDGKLSSVEVAAMVGFSPRHVRKIAKKYNLDRLHCGAQPHDKNHQFVSGRRIDPDGYVLVTCPSDHPYARQRTNRMVKLIYEHRLAVEHKIGRYLLPEEVVDHIDTLTLHNAPDNLRFFSGNGEHLHETIQGIPKKISLSGKQNIRLKYHQPEGWKRVDIYYQRRKRGDVRLRQILLAASRLGIDSPYLLGTTYWLKKAGIFPLTDSTIERALAELYQRWEADLAQ